MLVSSASINGLLAAIANRGGVDSRRYQFTSDEPLAAADMTYLRSTVEGKTADTTPAAVAESGAGLWAAQQFISGEVVVETKWQIAISSDASATGAMLPRSVAVGSSSRYVAQDEFMSAHGDRSKGTSVLSIPEFARERVSG